MGPENQNIPSTPKMRKQLCSFDLNEDGNDTWKSLKLMLNKITRYSVHPMLLIYNTQLGTLSISHTNKMNAGMEYIEYKSSMLHEKIYCHSYCQEAFILKAQFDKIRE
jgi:hypothetical protein